MLTAGRAFDPEDADDALPERDRAFARLLAVTTLRRFGQIDDLIARCLETPLAGRMAAANGALRLGAAQLAFLDTPPHAAVDTAVRLAPPRARGLVNAVLRRIAREGAGWRAAQDAERLNTPGWLWRSWRSAYGDARTRAIAAAHLVEPPLDLSAKGDPAAVAAAVGGAVLETGTVRRAMGRAHRRAAGLRRRRLVGAGRGGGAAGAPARRAPGRRGGGAVRRARRQDRAACRRPARAS